MPFIIPSNVWNHMFLIETSAVWFIHCSSLSFFVLCTFHSMATPLFEQTRLLMFDISKTSIMPSHLERAFSHTPLQVLEALEEKSSHIFSTQSIYILATLIRYLVSFLTYYQYVYRFVSWSETGTASCKNTDASRLGQI